MTQPNPYFELTREFNAEGRIVALASGQAVVYYRLAMMSKDGDWIIQESEEACRRVLEVLTRRGARYRPSAPLDVRWLAGGWSSHLELFDPEGRRIRCDFVSRPPRVSEQTLDRLFVDEEGQEPAVVSVESLIRMKQTQRAKDYPVIGELARRLPPQEEIELTTDPDRILELAREHGESSSRPAVRKARRGEGRRAVVVALAEEIDDLQLEDQARVRAYARAAAPYLREARKLDLALPEGHRRLCELAERLLPRKVKTDADAE